MVVKFSKILILLCVTIILQAFAEESFASRSVAESPVTVQNISIERIKERFDGFRCVFRDDRGVIVTLEELFSPMKTMEAGIYLVYNYDSKASKNEYYVGNNVYAYIPPNGENASILKIPGSPTEKLEDATSEQFELWDRFATRKMLSSKNFKEYCSSKTNIRFVDDLNNLLKESIDIELSVLLTNPNNREGFSIYMVKDGKPEKMLHMDNVNLINPDMKKRFFLKYISLYNQLKKAMLRVDERCSYKNL